MSSRGWRTDAGLKADAGHMRCLIKRMPRLT
jgi:hypothetical protein